MKTLALVTCKILLSLPIAYGLAYPYLHPGAPGGILREVQLLGAAGSVVAVVAFLLLVFFYAKDLQRSLALVRREARTAQPKSVWLMFLLPYNFIEDFWIVSNVAASLRRESAHNRALARFRGFGLGSGIGWCAAQVVSLLPNLLGSIAGIVAIVLWVVHWRRIRQANAALAAA